MPEIVLTKAGTYRSAKVPNKIFHFEQPQEVNDLEWEALEPSGYFKLLKAPAPAAIVAPKGGIKVRQKVASSDAAIKEPESEPVVEPPSSVNPPETDEPGVAV